MSVVDLHPEELLDKRARGELTPAESARLDAHVSTCAACQFELDARMDFADVGEFMPQSAALLALSGVRMPATEPRVTARARSRRRRPALLLTLAAALVAGGSLAAFAIRVAPQIAHQDAPRTAEAVAAVAPRAVRTPAPEAPAIALSALPMAPESRRAEAPRTKGATRTASELFRDANAARRDGDAPRAMALYRALEAEYPRSEESRLSYATLARLELDHGDARAALAGFDTYLSRGDAALGEEALVGRALSLQKLGSRDGEILAWQEVLRRFPKSIHARLAKSRLGALAEP